MPEIVMVCCTGWRVHSSGRHKFETFHDKKIKFLGFSFLDGYTDLTKYQQNPCWSGGKGWLICPFNGCFFTSIKEINRLRKEINRLLSKGIEIN